MLPADCQVQVSKGCWQQKHLHGVCFGLYFKGGPVYETEESQGVSHLLEHLCFRGLGGLSHDALQKELNPGTGDQVSSRPVQPGDTVLIMGKGHENYQEVCGVRHHFDDREIALAYLKEKEALKALRNEPSVSTDGHKVLLVGNIGGPKDVEGVNENGGEGVGLFRTEFLYMKRCLQKQ